MFSRDAYILFTAPMIQADCGSDANILYKCIQNAQLTGHVVRQMPGVSEGARVRVDGCVLTHARTRVHVHECAVVHRSEWALIRRKLR